MSLLYRKRIIVAIILFFVFFPISFTFLPSILSTRSIIALLGFIVFLFKSKGVKFYFTGLTGIVLILVLISLWSLFATAIFNWELDFSYVNYPVTIIIVFFSVYFVYFLMIKFEIDATFKNISEVIVITIFMQVLIALFSFLNTSFSSFLLGLQRLDERTSNISIYHVENSSRFIGFGVMFYTAGVFCGFALIILSFLLSRYRYLPKQKYFLWIAYLMIFSIGMGMSRTTIIGFLLSILIFIYFIWNNKYLIFKTLIPNLVVICVVLCVSLSVVLNLSDKYNKVFDFAFEVVIGFFDSGELKSSSSTATLETFILPSEERTYFVGTGINSLYSSKGDYIYSDIGYIRLLYYSGIIGVFLYFYLEFKVIKAAFRFNKALLFIVFLYLCLLNIKGISTVIVLCLLYCFIPSNRKELSS